MGQKRACFCVRARHVHGSIGAYQRDRCRCFACRIAYSKRHVPAADREDPSSYWAPRVGTIRRLEALHAMGWTNSAIGERAGMSRQALYELRTTTSPLMQATTAARIAAIYDELWDTPPPENQGSKRIRKTAIKKGWAPPLAWDDIDDPAEQPYREAPVDFDDIAIEQAMAGRRVTLTKAERAEAVKRLTAKGRSAREIAALLGTSERLVTRKRSSQEEAA